MAPTPGSTSYQIASEWGDGFVLNAQFSPDTAVDGWTVKVTFSGEIVNLWNAVILERDGDSYVLGNASYNAAVPGGGTVDFGFQAAGSADGLTFANSAPPILPDILAAAASVIEGDPSDSTGPASLMGPLSTSGNTILNAAGEAVTIEAVNWFGMETETFAPHGLWTRNWQEMMDEIKATGFNAIRLPFSLEAVLDAGAVPNGIDFAANPDLQGLGALQILDKIVDYAQTIELGIILDNHRSAAGSGPNGNGLWYDGGYSEADWIAAWELLAARYGDSPAIIGADLVNEPHGAVWGDWAAAAERAGNAVLNVAPDWLIVVEGVGSYEGDPYWWGGSLKGVADRPVVLDASDKLVYSPHDYPASVYPQPWFFDGSNLFEVFSQNWGFIHEQNIAPLFLGEFGSRLETEVDRTWADAIVRYLGGDFDGDGAVAPGAVEISFAWWSWNPNSGDTGGILLDDWRTIRQDAVDVLEPILDGSDGSAATSLMTFVLSLSEAVSQTTEVSFATADGTATAGEDYVATSGTLTFAPGETQKTVSVAILPDLVAEGDETFALDVTGPAGTARAIGVILGDDGAPDAPPVVSGVRARVSEGDGTANVTLRLSEAADEAVSVSVRTRDISALGGEDYLMVRGTVVFAPGQTEASVAIEILDDAVAEEREVFRLVLTGADGAHIEDKSVRVRIDDDDLPLA